MNAQKKGLALGNESAKISITNQMTFLEGAKRMRDNVHLLAG